MVLIDCRRRLEGEGGGGGGGGGGVGVGLHEECSGGLDCRGGLRFRRGRGSDWLAWTGGQGSDAEAWGLFVN